MRHAKLRQHAGRFFGRRDLVVGAKELQHAAGTVVEGDAGLAAQFGEAALAVVRDPLHARFVARKVRRVAVAQEVRQPAPLLEVEPRPQRQGRVLREQPAHHLERHARCGPRSREARTDAARIGEARLEPGPALALDDRDLVAGLGEIIGAGRADHAGAQHHHSHGVTLSDATINRA